MIRKIALGFWLFGALLSWGQEGTTSPYSLAGLGELNFRGTQINRFMGGLDVYADSIHANLSNPASYGELKLTTYSLGIHYKSNLMNDENFNKTGQTATLDYLAVGIPAGKFGFGFGIIPLTSVGYRVNTINENVSPSVIDQFQGSGGVNQAFFSIGFPLFKVFHIGGTLNYNFGSIEYNTEQYRQGVDIGTLLTRKSVLSGMSYLLSANLTIPFSKNFEMKAMYAFQPEAHFDSSNQQIIFTRSLANNSITDFEEINLIDKGLQNTTMKLPLSQKMGFGFGKPKKWFLGFQRNFNPFSAFENRFLTRENISYKDASQFTVGGFFIPNYASLTNYFNRAVYRFGFRSEQMGVVVNNIPLTETGISFGIGLPMAGYSNANVGLEIGSRGEKSNGLVRETFFALRVGLSLNALWFIKPKYN
ncbi:MAG: hypothetical protein ACO3SY_05755 [Flavobacteriaceae bacterium]|jgi:hypothetical protein